MNTNLTFIITLVICCIILEISGIYLLNLGKKSIYPIQIKYLGKICCILSPILLVIGIIGLSI